jgi:hypothetical protein
MTRPPELERRRSRAPLRDGAEEEEEDGGELTLEQTLIALHRSERAPRGVLKQVQARLKLESERPSVKWARHLEGLMGQLSGWPLAAVVAILISLVTWHRQQREAVWHEVAELDTPESAISGVFVPGSLQLRLSGDPQGMGVCEGHFLLGAGDASPTAPARVRWTRCDLPDALTDELRRPFSPMQAAAPLRLLVRGHWAGANEFEALGLRLLP